MHINSCYSLAHLESISESDLNQIIKIANNDNARLIRLLERRRFGEPINYLKGFVQFKGRDFKLDRRVFIPDPLTEHLVDYAVNKINQFSIVLEVGIGNGWIGITLEKERPDLNIYGVDIDPGAISLASENKYFHTSNIEYQESYFVCDCTFPEPDYIIAVLPYGGDALYSEQEIEERAVMPPISICDPAGVLMAQLNLINSVILKKWRSSIIMEIGHITENQVSIVIPNHINWRYHALRENYAILTVDFI